MNFKNWFRKKTVSEPEIPRERILQNIRWARINQRNRLLETWVAQAEPRLEAFIRENPFVFNGLNYKTPVPGCSFAYTSGMNIGTIAINEKGEIYAHEADSQYSDVSFGVEKIAAWSLAFRLMKNVTGLHGPFEKPYINYGIGRNRLIAEIKNRTGVTL